MICLIIVGQVIKINFTMLPTIEENKESKNAIGDFVGKTLPDEHVIISAHIDSWDVGQGAMDDGGGVIISAEVHNVLTDLNLHPKRTIRTVLWTAEEFGLLGGRSYVETHKANLDKISAAFESDSGTFNPLGLDYAGSEDAGCILQAILALAPSLNASMLRRRERVSTDIVHLQDQGVPGVSLNSDESMYFWYHHSEADTMTIQDPDQMDSCLALYTISSYVLADLSIKLPRGNSSEWIVDPDFDDNSGMRINTMNIIYLMLIISLFYNLY